jgi:hypothetical protein
MIEKIFLTLALVLLSACSQLDVKFDYDPEYVFEGKNKYVVVHDNGERGDTLTQDRVSNAIKNALNAKSYKEVSKQNADLVFVFHINVQDKSDIYTDYQMMGYGGYGFARGFGGSMVATTSTYSYTEGTLVVDALNPKTQKIVWRGIAKDELSTSNSTPQEKTEYINDVVFKLMQNFPREAK